MIHLLPALFIASLFAFSTALAQTEKPASASAEGDVAWKEVEKAIWLPPPPAEWSRKEPTEEELAKFRAQRVELIEKAADKAKDFYTKFPQHTKAEDGRRLELEALQAVVGGGRTNLLLRLEAVETAWIARPGVSEDERFQIRFSQIDRKAALQMRVNKVQAFAELEKDARQLLTEFPRRMEIWQLLMTVAGRLEAAKARQIVNEILANPALVSLHEEAKGFLTRLGYLDKRLDLKFTAVDGRPVDLAKMRGKVVLVDFWATWCGPCIAALPEVKAAYEKLHPKGFEIVGISFDEKKDQLQQFVKAKEMSWPHYFDGKRWENEFGKQFGINGIPAMWLVDKKGTLRDLNGNDDLAEKVEKLLAEKE